jgi:hypothetical protein
MADCKKIIQLVEDHRNRGKKDNAEMVAGKALWAGAKFVIGKIVGKAGGPLMEALKPTSMGTPVEGYYRTLKQILIATEDGADDERLRPLLDKLKLFDDSIRIERSFGINSNCYESIKLITQDAELLLEPKPVNPA